MHSAELFWPSAQSFESSLSFHLRITMNFMTHVPKFHQFLWTAFASLALPFATGAGAQASKGFQFEEPPREQRVYASRGQSQVLPAVQAILNEDGLLAGFRLGDKVVAVEIDQAGRLVIVDEQRRLQVSTTTDQNWMKIIDEASGQDVVGLQFDEKGTLIKSVVVSEPMPSAKYFLADSLVGCVPGVPSPGCPSAPNNDAKCDFEFETCFNNETAKADIAMAGCTGLATTAPAIGAYVGLTGGPVGSAVGALAFGAVGGVFYLACTAAVQYNKAQNLNVCSAWKARCKGVY
jgi:hypothetical protein